MRLPPQPRVLIVDDSVVVRRILALAVSQMPELSRAAVEQAADGAEALERLQAHPFDLVLCDIRMPLVDGYELLRVARTELGLTIPIVLISTMGRKQDVQRGMDAGATAYILKPLSPHHIKLALRELLDAPGGRERPVLPRVLAQAQRVPDHHQHRHRADARDEAAGLARDVVGEVPEGREVDAERARRGSRRRSPAGTAATARR